MKRKALLSVSDKTGIVDFAGALAEVGFEIISTGGTYRALREAGLDPVPVEQVTGFPECLGGRVKTLHPKIYGGLLADRANPEHMKQISALDMDMIDVLAVNLYPFKETVKSGASWDEIIENIDIGGPAMIRAAAKNYRSAAVAVDPADYPLLVKELRERGHVSDETRFTLAAKAFMYTADYDSVIAACFREKSGGDAFPPTLTFSYEKAYDLRYGENPHQQAAFYKEALGNRGLADAVQLHGKELSFNNLNDTHGALELLREFDAPTIVACKHTVPCGVGSAETIAAAYRKAYAADPVSIFGGIIVANREIDAETAAEINKIFIEVVLAPSFTDEALDILKRKKNIRVLQMTLCGGQTGGFDIKKISGGILLQQPDRVLLPQGELSIPTVRKPTEKEMDDLLFAWKIVKHVKSNGIAIGKNGQSVGIGTGQTSRIWALRQAIDHAREHLGDGALRGAALASDAFFPFDDCAAAAAEAGITAIIQPGGSVNDKDSVKVCDAHGLTMVFTGMRHFKH